MSKIMLPLMILCTLISSKEPYCNQFNDMDSLSFVEKPWEDQNAKSVEIRETNAEFNNRRFSEVELASHVKWS